MNKIELGSSNYKDFIEKNIYYVDKTLLIEELIEKTSQVVLITRPRRFGKTLNLSMLEYYFDIRQDSDYLFKNKKIVSTAGYKKHLNKYPVIFLTLKSIEGSSFENIYSSFKTAISNLYGRYKYLKEKLDEIDKNLFDKILSKNADIGEYKNSLYKLSEFLYKHHQKKVVILLDEYDSVVNSILDRDLYKQVLDLLRGFIGDAFKGNDYLEKGILTGILRIAKEELFSGANNVEVFTILSDEFKDKFGFTEEETTKALNDFNLLDKSIEVKRWYNGYLFGCNSKVTIYNPYSINNYLKMKKIENYWINTGQSTFIKNLLFNATFDIKIKLIDLTLGKNLTLLIEENIVMIELDNSENLWSLLLFSGYLKLISNSGYKFKVAAVNEEVKNYLKKLLEIHFEKVGGSSMILNSLQTGDIDSFSSEPNRISLSKISYYDIKEENSYHMFLLGMFIQLESSYHITTNREAGYGRYDICLEPINKNNIGYIFELKKIEIYNRESEQKLIARLSLAANNAIKQIEEKKYLVSMKSKKIIGIGIAFAGKKVFVDYINF